MSSQSVYISDLLFRIKILKDKVAGFESGEKYIQMQKQHRKALAADARKIRQLEAELASAHAQIIDVRNKWMQTCEDVMKEKEKALKEKDLELKKMQEAMYEAQRQRDEIKDKLREKNLELYEVKGQLEETNEKMHGIVARINKNHTNSSKPSSMEPNHSKDNNGRTPSGKKPGGQPGHEHHARKRLEPTIEIEVPAPEEFLNPDNFKPTGEYVRKQLVKFHMITEVIEYYTMEFRNLATGQRVHAAFPGGLQDEVTYDGSVKSLAYNLTHVCNVGIQKTHDFLKEISKEKLDLSTGMICNLSKQFSEKTPDERDQIFLDLVSSEIMHSDFTFGRMNGKQAAVIVCVTPDGEVLYQGRAKKGDEGVKGSPLEVFENTLVSDHEAAIIKHGSRHQECIQHVQRYARSSAENEPDRKWNKELLEWTSGSIHYWKQIHDGLLEYDRQDAEKWIKKLSLILAKAKEEYEYIPPSKYYMDGYNLFSRMYKDMEAYVLFLRDPSVPPTNNVAERMARKFKRKAHQVMSFRSQAGVDYFCDGLSILESLKSKGENIYEEVAEKFNEIGKRGYFLVIGDDGTKSYVRAN